MTVKKGVLLVLIVVLLALVVLPAGTAEACKGRGCEDDPLHRRCRTRGMARLNNPHCGTGSLVLDWTLEFLDIGR